MSTSEPKKIINADRMDNKIIVSYSDKSTAVFSSKQLEEIPPERVVEADEGKELSGE